MLKKSIVIICVMILSCIYTVSCKSRTSGDSSSLASLTVTAPDKIKDYVKGVRVVAVSSVETCADNQKLVTLGQSNLTDEKSFEEEANFVSLNDENASKISLYASCFPYEVTLAYICEENTINNKQYKKGLCFKGTSTAKKEDITDNKLRLEISLKGQGSWAGFGKVTATTEESLKLADLFNTECLFSINLNNYATIDPFSTDSLKDREFPFVSKTCWDNSKQIIKDTEKGEVETIVSSTGYTLKEGIDSRYYEITEQYSSYLIKNLVINDSLELNFSKDTFLLEKYLKTTNVPITKLKVTLLEFSKDYVPTQKTVTWTKKQ